MVIGASIFLFFLQTYIQIVFSDEFRHTQWELSPGPEIIEADTRYKNQSRLRRVVGGDESKNVFLFMGGLLRGSCEVKCGVTILDQEHVLTAAHCVRTGRPQEFQVLVGTNDLQQCRTTQLVPVRKVTVHPDYKGGVHDDIAVLKLARPLDFKKVKPVTIHAGDPPTPANVKFLGWGATRSRSSINSIILKKGISSAIAHEICKSNYRIRDRLDRRHFCIIHRSSAPCKGDSGGPVLIEDHIRDSYLLVGLISTGPEDCSYTVPTICTSIKSYIPWITKTKLEK